MGLGTGSLKTWLRHGVARILGSHDGILTGRLRVARLRVATVVIAVLEVGSATRSTSSNLQEPPVDRTTWLLCSRLRPYFFMKRWPKTTEGKMALFLRWPALVGPAAPASSAGHALHPHSGATATRLQTPRGWRLLGLRGALSHNTAQRLGLRALGIIPGV